MKVSAPDWAMGILVLLVIWVIYGWHKQNESQQRDIPDAAKIAAAHQRTTTVPSTINPNPNRRDIRESRELIRAVSETYDVPAGILYGIWRKESDALASGWSTGRGWYRAPELVAPGGRCLSEYNAQRCDRWWRGLQAICSQRRNGTPICDPNQVHVSYAYAMGPMQVLPSVIIDVDGSNGWTANAADFDQDGVVDPHSLPDAMAIAALEIRHRFERASATMAAYDAWIYAANGYYGSQSAGYYEGTTAGRRGVQDYWQQWCTTTGDCGSATSAVAAR